MEWQKTPYTIPLIVAGIGMVLLALYVYRRRRSRPEALTLVLLMVAVAVWSLLYTLELSSTVLSAKVFWAKLKYLGIAIAPTAWLIFALQYTGRGKWISRRNLVLLAIVPLFMLLMVWTNDVHHLYWTDVALNDSGAFSVLSLPMGPAFWFWVAYCYLLSLFGTLLIIQNLMHTQRLYRRQAGALIIAVVAPWVGNVIFVSGRSPFPHLDLTPFAFAVSCMACAWGLFRFRLLDIVPVARHAIIENMGDAVIVLDPSDHIMDMNPAAERLIDRSASESVGQPIGRMWPSWSDRFGLPPDTAETSLEISLGEKANRRIYGIRTSCQVDSKDQLVWKAVVLRDITKRKRAEEALRQSEERYRTLVDSSLTGIYIIQEGMLRYVNRRFLELSSRTLEELQEQSGLDMVHPDDRKFVGEAMARLMSGQDATGRYEFRIITKEGGVRWLETFGVAFEYEGKAALFANMIDITERKKAEEAIIRVKEQWERTFSAVPDLIAILDDKHEIVRVNKAMADSLGVSTDDAVGLICYEAVHGTKEPPPFCPHAKLMADGQEHFTEFYEERLGGDFMVTVSPLHDTEGRLIGSVHVARDVTERKRAEEALRESEEKYRNVVENVSVGVLVAQDGKLVFVNSAAFDIIGYTREELLSNTNPFDFIHPDDQAMVLERHMKRLAGEKVSELYSFRVVGKDEGIRWVDVSGTRIDWQGKPATLNFFTDISDRVRVENERKKLEAHLRESQTMEAISTLAGGIAHEFNNALVGVAGNIELLEMDMPHDENIAKYAAKIMSSTGRMAGLTNQLLAYARGGKYQPKTMTLNDLVKDTTPLIRHNMDSAISLETNLSKDILNVEADVTQMQMVLTAILSNSAEAIEDQGRILITTRDEVISEEFAETHPELTPGAYVCLVIEDDGRGMDEETRSRVFEPFFTTNFQGRGLGMAAVYGIVKGHDGAVFVDSEPGKGTEVRIYLPASETRIEEPREPKAKLSTALATILVIEDEEMVLEISRSMLEELGCRVLEAKTGKEAIDIAKTFDGDIDLALLDMKLPDMEGSRVYPAIKEARPNLIVIVCSGYSLEDGAQEILDAGAHGFIQKPFTFATLSAKITEVLASR